MLRVLCLDASGAESRTGQEPGGAQRLCRFRWQLLADIDRALLATVRVPFSPVPIRAVRQALPAAGPARPLTAGFLDLLEGNAVVMGIVFIRNHVNERLAPHGAYLASVVRHEA